MSENITGLRQRLLVAKTEAEIVNLLEEGLKFESASGVTRRRWKRAATRRTASLKGTKVEVVAASKKVALEEEVEFVSAKKDRRKRK